MKTNIRAALAVFALTVFLPLIGLASNNPIPGIDVVVQKKPSGNAITVKTDAQGQASLPNLAPGDYTATFVVPVSLTVNTPKDAPKGEVKGDGKQKAPTAIGSGEIKKPSPTLNFTEAKVPVAFSESWSEDSKRGTITFTVPPGRPQTVRLSLLLPVVEKKASALAAGDECCNLWPHCLQGCPSRR